MRQLSAAANYVPWAIHCHDSPLCNGIKAVQGDGAAMLGLSLLLQCQMDFLKVSRSEGWSRSKSSPHSRWCGRSSAQAPPLLSNHYEDMGWHTHGASQHILFAATKVRSWLLALLHKQKYSPHGRALSIKTPTQLLLAPCHSPFFDAWSSQHWN